MVPVGRDARRAVFGHVGEEGLAALGVAARQHPAVGAEPGHLGGAVQGLAIGVPSPRVGAAEAVHQLLRLREWQVVGRHLHVEQHDVDAVEEVQVDMHHLERHRCVAGPRHDLHRGDVAAAEHPHRRAAGRVAAAALAASLAIEEALHVGQEGDELVVVPLLEAARLALVLVDVFAPRRRVAQIAQQLPGRTAFDGVVAHSGGNQPQRPEQHLAQVAHQHGLGRRGIGRSAGVLQHGPQCRQLRSGEASAAGPRRCARRASDPAAGRAGSARPTRGTAPHPTMEG